MKIFYMLMLLFVLLISCTVMPVEQQPEGLVEAPASLRQQAVIEAERYLGMEYEWGGQDFPDPRGVDCSGLVVNVYKTVTDGTEYSLPFHDAAVVHFMNDYTIEISTPTPGDLIFMGDEKITHIAIFESMVGQTITFIDSYSIAGGVERREYHVGNPMIHYYARLLLVPN